MAVLQNGYRDRCGSAKFYSGSAVSNSAYPEVTQGNLRINGMMRNFCNGEGITDKKASIPVGYRNPNAIVIAQKSGGMGVTARTVEGTGAVSTPGNLAGGLNGVATIDGIGGLTADMSLIIAAIATLAGVGGLSGGMTGTLWATADLEGEGSASAALGAISSAVADLIGTGGISAAMRGDAYASADIAPATTVSADVIARAVWDVMISEHTATGTTGEALNNVGAASNPWSQMLVDNNDPATFGEFVQKILTTAKFMGLK
jgi:hypothetical protein